MKKIIGIFLFIGLLSASAAGAKEAATITSVQGQVTIHHADGTSASAQSGDNLHPTDEVAAGADSRAEIKLGDGSIMTLLAHERKAVKDLIGKNGDNDTWVKNIWDNVERLTTKAGKRKVPGLAAPMTDADNIQPLWKSSKKKPKSGDIRDAINSLEDLTKSITDPEMLLETHFLIGECYDRLGEKSHARQAYQEVIDLAPASDWAKKAREKLKELK